MHCDARWNGVSPPHAKKLFLKGKSRKLTAKNHVAGKEDPGRVCSGANA